MSIRIILIFLVAIVVFVVAGIVASEYYTSQPGFCGSCHIMKSYYDSWEKDKHGEKGITCVECHYAPGEKGTLKARFKGLGQLFSYLATKDKEVRKPPKVPDDSCLMSNCHPREKFLDKELKFTEKVPYVHKAHEEKTIEGQKPHCDTCHLHRSVEKHFEVPKEACYLCHFKDAEFNKDRSKCSLCHEIPTKPLQKQKEEEATPEEEKLITHQSLEEAKVPCWSCHYELIQGRGDIRERECLFCHQSGILKALEKEDKKEVMHKAHVAEQNAKCFECHDYIQHKEIKGLAYLDSMIANCNSCHPEPHIHQKLLIAGEGGKGLKKTFPIAHYDMKTTCAACHTKDSHDIKGRKIKGADPKNCMECHLKDKEKEVQAEKWKTDVSVELKEARNVEKNLIEAVGQAKGKVPEKTIQKAMALLKDGQENLRIVDAGGGVHNKKYSILLIETAIENFEDAINLFNEPH